MYVDDAGNEQGPFSTAKLCGWLKRGHLTAARQARPRREGGGPLRPIGEWSEFAQAVAIAAEAAAAVEAAAAAEAEAADAAGGAVEGAAPAEGSAAAAAVGGGAAAQAEPPPTASSDDGASLSADEGASLWTYYDDHGKVQGPYSAAKLLSWLRAGHLRATRMVRPHGADSEHGRFEAIRATQPFARVLGAGVLPAPPPTVPLHVGSAGAAAAGDGGAARGAAYVETPLWLYVDASGSEQGPFAAWQVAAWYQASQLPPTTMIRHVSDRTRQYRPLSTVPQLGGVAPSAGAAGGGEGGGGEGGGLEYASTEEARRLDRLLGPGAAHYAAAADIGAGDVAGAAGHHPAATVLAPGALAPGQYKDYAVTGGFSSTTGRFTPQDMAGDNYWKSKGIPNDRAGRLMNHFFDVDAYQEQMNARKAGRSSKKARTG